MILNPSNIECAAIAIDFYTNKYNFDSYITYTLNYLNDHFLNVTQLKDVF